MHLTLQTTNSNFPKVFWTIGVGTGVLAMPPEGLSDAHVTKTIMVLSLGLLKGGLPTVPIFITHRQMLSSHRLHHQARGKVSYFRPTMVHWWLLVPGTVETQ
jgi:hypothetical protein